MGKLVDQPLRSMFQGVSRQPDTVRLPGQVQDAENILFSVVSGGFEKRMPFEFVKEMANTPTSGDVYCYFWKRDDSEQYVLIIENTDLHVYDLLTGDEKTVTFPDGKAYLANTEDTRNGFACATILDSTFIVNKSVTAAMDGTTTTTTIGGPVRSFSDLPRLGESVPAYLSGWAAGSTWANADVADGEIWEVNDGTSDLSKYFVQLTKETNSTWVWRETADPNHENAFDATTMPHRLDRQPDGSFIFQQVTWEDRGAGDPDIVPDPDFIGSVITDIAYWRDRLIFMSGESVYTSQAGDYFNLWPGEATQVIDSDPIARIAGTAQVNILQYGVPFRKSLFLTGQQAQFELSSGVQDILSPSKAVVDEATNYAVDVRARPLAFGDELYFVANSGPVSSVFEYYYEDDTLSNTAVDSAKHAQGYIDETIYGITGDTTTQTLFMRAGDANTFFVYRTYWDGNERQQRAWSKYTVSGLSKVLGASYIGGYLYVVGRATDNATFLLKHEIEYRPGPKNHETAVSLDMRWESTGSYDAGTDTTSWTLPYPHDDDIVAVTSSDFGDGNTGRILTTTTTGTYGVTVDGDWSGGDMIFGRPYESRVQLSKQYLRETDGTSSPKVLTSGRLQLRTMSFDFEDTAYFEVHVTPNQRTARTYRFTGRQLGEGADMLGGAVPVIEDGTFKVPIRSRGDTVTIEIKSSEPLPFRITSARWVGFYNEITRQE